MKKFEDRSVNNKGFIGGNVNTGNMESTDTTTKDNKLSWTIIWSAIITGVFAIIVALIKGT